MLKNILTQTNMFENILTLGQNSQAKGCFGLGLNFTVYGLTLGQNTLIFISFLKFYDLGLFHTASKDIGLTMQDICLRMFIGLSAYGLRFFA
jgi:hypothetical protein